MDMKEYIEKKLHGHWYLDKDRKIITLTTEGFDYIGEVKLENVEEN